jgi:hypothetical protein
MSKNSTSVGIGFLGLLTIAFIVLKLTGVISWLDLGLVIIMIALAFMGLTK